MPKVHPTSLRLRRLCSTPGGLFRPIDFVFSAVAMSSCSVPSRTASEAIETSHSLLQKGTKRMDDYKVGDVVRITGAIMPGSVGTVVSIDKGRHKYLVRITEAVQNYYGAEEIELFRV